MLPEDALQAVSGVGFFDDLIGVGGRDGVDAVSGGDPGFETVEMAVELVRSGGMGEMWRETDLVDGREGVDPLVGEVVDREDAAGGAEGGGAVFFLEEGEGQGGVHIVGMDDIPLPTEERGAVEGTSAEGGPTDEAIGVLWDTGGVVDPGAFEERRAVHKEEGEAAFVGDVLEADLVGGVLVPAHPERAEVKGFVGFDVITQDEVARDGEDDRGTLFGEGGGESSDHVAEAADFGPRSDLGSDHEDTEGGGWDIAFGERGRRNAHGEALSIWPWET